MFFNLALGGMPLMQLKKLHEDRVIQESAVAPVLRTPDKNRNPY